MTVRRRPGAGPVARVGPVTGRALPDPGFAGDDGAPDPPLVAAVAAARHDPARAPEVLAALAAARVLVPVVAVGTGREPGGHGPVRESGTEMALATLVGADGRRAVPVFSGLPALAAWDPAARPVPVRTQQAALAALAEGAALLVLDVADPPPYVVAGADLRRLAEGDPCRPLYADPVLRATLAALVSAEPAVRAAHWEPAPGRDARVVLTVSAADELLVPRLVEGLRRSAELRGRVRRGIDVAVLSRPAGQFPGRT